MLEKALRGTVRLRVGGEETLLAGRLAGTITAIVQIRGKVPNLSQS